MAASGEIWRIPPTATHEQVVRAKAQRTVAANAIDATEAANLMMMLGIHPSQSEDDELLSGVAVPPVMGGVQPSKPPSEYLR